MPLKGKKPPSSIKFTQDLLEKKKEEDLYLLDVIQIQTKGVLGELQYIAEIIRTHKTVAEVEDLNAKIKAAYERIKKYLDPGFTPDQEEDLSNARNAGGIQLEKNPLVDDLGGMPLEVISSEWQELASTVLDKAELKNLINNKLKDRAELANRLKLKNRLGNQPKQRMAQQITPKFEKIQQTLKYILKEIPAPPAPAPHIDPPRYRVDSPRPRPGGG
jgi:hypothetical protein